MAEQQQAGLAAGAALAERTGETAEAFVEALVAHGVDCLFLNPGTDTFPVQEALAKCAALGRPAPRTVLCLFEVVALAAAHGYYAATGRPQAVMVHVDVGTQNLGGMLHCAQRGHAAVLICAGRAPYTTDPALRGHRDGYIHWLQEQMDQHGIVRNYVKWDYELRRPEQVGEVVARALQIAASDPPGPVYLTLPRENLMQTVPEGGAPAAGGGRPQTAPPARLGAGDPDALREVALRLVESERPLVLTGASGRTAAGFHALVRLAELLALPVVESRNRVNFPADHPLHQGYEAGPLLEQADLVLVLDQDVPYIPTRVAPAPDATVIQIDVDPVKERIPLWSFPLTQAIRADSARALDLLAEYAAPLVDEAARRRIAARRAACEARHREQRSTWAEAARRAEQETPIAPVWLAHCLGELARETTNALFVDETVTNSGVLWQQAPANEPGRWFVSGGSGLGWGLGAALGVRLANPDRPVIAMVGDGSFVFGEPLAAFWAAQQQRAPFMAVIFNNACYNATKRPLVAAYPEGYSVARDAFIGIDLAPAPRYDLLAQAVGAHGERVEDPAQVLPALRRGLERLRAGQAAIVDVQLARP
ncbi:MAG TPA: thiamine pyrophosphate-requiring protein [Dehalococcoidia bacterium]|nr:thiamine pyrophosphate-requiring protein [Dehalococcoidia bacterium]